jgi:hypothetical protein
VAGHRAEPGSELPLMIPIEWSAGADCALRRPYGYTKALASEGKPHRRRGSREGCRHRLPYSAPPRGDDVVPVEAELCDLAS